MGYFTDMDIRYKGPTDVMGYFTDMDIRYKGPMDVMRSFTELNIRYKGPTDVMGYLLIWTSYTRDLRMLWDIC